VQLTHPSKIVHVALFKIFEIGETQDWRKQKKEKQLTRHKGKTPSFFIFLVFVSVFSMWLFDFFNKASACMHPGRHHANGNIATRKNTTTIELRVAI